MPYGNVTPKRRFIVFTILFIVWMIFSGHFDPRHLGLGVACAALVATLSSDLLLPARARAQVSIGWRFLVYVPWLLWQVVLANLHVIRLIFRPAEIRSQVVRFKTSLPGDVAKVALGTSITLTPGTVTMDIDGDEFFVHALSDKAAEDLKSGAMERRVAKIFIVSDSAKT